MKPLFLCYAGCSTCKKAEKWLRDNGVEFDARPIAEQNPTVEELTEWIARSGLPVRRFFNTSGLKYKQMNLKERVAAEPDEALVELLATDGMLVKRPLIVTGAWVLVGFREEEWRAALL